MSKTSRPVYSTSIGRLCPGCGNATANCSCNSDSAAGHNPSGTIYISRERKGRGGKQVSVVKQLPLNQLGLKMLASKLKNQCGSGGTVTNSTIEIQGEHREKLKSILEAEGYQVKLSGG